MKNWIIGAALLMFTSLQVSAQQGKREQINPEERAKKATEKMATELKLSEEQKAQILELNLEQAKKRQVEMESEMELRKKRSDEMKAHQEKIQSILTEEQRTKWEELKSEQRDKRRSNGPRGQGRDGMSRQGRGN
jgi:Spy/CpxP family protein refolding chaperone